LIDAMTLRSLVALQAFTPSTAKATCQDSSHRTREEQSSGLPTKARTRWNPTALEPVTTLFPAEGHWDLFIAKDGSEGHYVRTDEGFIATRFIKRQ